MLYIPTETRHSIAQLKRSGLRLEKAREKTFIGRVEKGFDFLGFRLSPQGITVAEATWKRFRERALRLYEQDRREPEGSPRLDAYMRRWAERLRYGIRVFIGY